MLKLLVFINKLKVSQLNIECSVLKNLFNSSKKACHKTF